MVYEKMTTEYLCYLMNRAQIEAAGDFGYFRLCKQLLEIPFIPIIPMDENRSSECRELRTDFFNSYNYGGSYEVDSLPDSGTMLELLIVLAEKMQYNLKLSEYDKPVKDFFLEMVGNAGIQFNNYEFGEDLEKRTISTNMERINIRQFQWDGYYSFFPLREPHSDQRYEELIVQMNNYIEENYDFS